LQQTAPTTLDVTAGRVILRVREVLGSGVLLLEGRDGKFWKDHTRNCAPYHLPHIDGTVHPGTSHIFAGLKCRLCGSPKRAATMVICDVCSKQVAIGVSYSTALRGASWTVVLPRVC
jgi:hypothetical protein